MGPIGNSLSYTTYFVVVVFKLLIHIIYDQKEKESCLNQSYVNVNHSAGKRTCQYVGKYRFPGNGRSDWWSNKFGSPHPSRDRASPKAEMSFWPFKKLCCPAQLGFQHGQIAQWRAASTRHHVHRASEDCLSAATFCPLHPSLPRSSLFRVSRDFYILYLF